MNSVHQTLLMRCEYLAEKVQTRAFLAGGPFNVSCD